MNNAEDLKNKEGLFELGKIRTINIDNLNSISELFVTDEKGGTLIDYLIKFNKKAIENIDESFLMQEYGEKKLLDYLLEKNISFKSRIKFFKSKEIMEYFFEIGRYDLFVKFDIYDLTAKADINNTYLDYLIEDLKKVKRVPVYYADQELDNKKFAKVMLVFAKHNLTIKGMNTVRLMYEDENGIRLVDELLNNDEEFVMEKIITKEALKDLELYSYLKSKGFKLRKYKFEVDKGKLSRDYLDEQFKALDSIQINSEYESLLSEFRSVMQEDDLSDRALIENVIRAYRKAISIDENIINEVKLLINIKKNNKEFCFKKNMEGNFYRNSDKSVNLDEGADIRTIYHEIGHALFYLVVDAKVPDGYGAIVEKLRNDPNFKLFSVAILEICDEHIKKATIEASAEYDNYEENQMSKECLDYISGNLEGTKEWMRDEYRRYGASEEEIKALLGEGIPSVEEVKAAEKKIITHALAIAIFSINHPTLRCTSDIIDSIYMGEYYDGTLVESRGKKIKGKFGHGTKYYKKRGLPVCFNETMAHFSVFFKSENKNELLEKLREMFGSEFIDMMIESYNSIINSQRYEMQETL
jgi:hypothetical protein